VCINTYIRRRKGVFKYFPGFSGAGEVSHKEYFSGAREIFEYTSPAPEKPEKYLKTPFRPRRSVGEAGEAGEVFIYIVSRVYV